VLPEQECGDVAFAGADEHGQSTLNVKNSEDSSGTKSPQNIKSTKDSMGVVSIKSSENNALVLAGKALVDGFAPNVATTRVMVTSTSVDMLTAMMKYGRNIRRIGLKEATVFRTMLVYSRDIDLKSEKASRPIAKITPKLTHSYRAGSFPFFKLPKDIRQKIFQLIVAPLNTHHEPCTNIHLEQSTRKGYALFQVRNLPRVGTFKPYSYSHYLKNYRAFYSSRSRNEPKLIETFSSLISLEEING
jgi:hypothetical protein